MPARDDKLDFERLVVVLFGIKIVSDRARTRWRLIAVVTAAAMAGRSTAAAMGRGRRFLRQNGKLVTTWAHNLLVPIFTMIKDFEGIQSKKQKGGGTIRYSQFTTTARYKKVRQLR